MKVKELKIIMKKFNYNGSYANILLKLSDSDVKVLLDNLENENSEILLNFLLSYIDNASQFERLGIENAKKIIISKILSANRTIYSELILKIYNHNIKKFQTKEEWLTYINHITGENIITLIDDLGNLDYVLSNIKERRVEAIKKVLILPSTTTLNKKFTNLFQADDNFIEYLDLLLLGYDQQNSKKLIHKIEEEQTKIPKIDGEESTNVLDYLKEPKTFNSYLPKIFIRTPSKEYKDVMDLLNKIEDENLLQHYIFTDVPKKHEKLLRNYIEKVVMADTDSLKKAYIKLLDSGYISCLLKQRLERNELTNQKNISQVFNKNRISKRIDEITETLEQFDKEDGKSVGMACLLNVLPYDVWKSIPVNAEKEVLKSIYINIDILNISYIPELVNLTNEEMYSFIGILHTRSFIEKENLVSRATKILRNRKIVSLAEFYQHYLEMDEKLLEQEKEKLQQQRSEVDLYQIIEKMSDDAEISIKTLKLK